MSSSRNKDDKNYKMKNMGRKDKVASSQGAGRLLTFELDNDQRPTSSSTNEHEYFRIGSRDNYHETGFNNTEEEQTPSYLHKRRRFDLEYNNPFPSSDYYSSQNIGRYDEIYSYCNSEPVNRHHRTISVHRNTAIKDTRDTCTFRTFPRLLENRRNWMSPADHVMQQVSLEQRANNIANRMEQDAVLMEDTLTSEQLRREALRDMPQCLTVKRIIKKKLNTSVNRHYKRKPLGLYKSLKYRLSMKATKMRNSLKSLAYSFELWYNSLKIIEGHFGSGISTYFKFFRWLFIMNCLITLFVIGFIVVPQLLYINISPAISSSQSKLVIYDNTTNKSNVTSVIVPEPLLKWHNYAFQNNESFTFRDIFTGEGYFTNTILYYGFYTKDVVNIIPNQNYNMSYAYFFTMFCMYLISFIVLSTSMAKSYRRSFIETQGGLKNVYAHKIFCGWDYSIATQEAADLKLSSIYNELKELLNDSIKKAVQVSLKQKCWTFILQLMANAVILILLVGTGYIMWYLLERHSSTNSNSSGTAVITAIIINVIMIVFPALFSYIVRYEDYSNPKTILYITLIRTFFLKTVVIGVFLAFWLTLSKNDNCWETSIGQHIYRLILFDFLFSVVIAAFVEAARHCIYKRLWKGIGVSNFDIAKYTLNLMYNQTLFWVGLYFSPLLSVVVVLKLFCTWYIRRTCVLHFCQPSSKSWRAAQTQTWFLILSFISLVLVLIAHGYIIVNLTTSSCGPFGSYEYIYEIIIKGILQLEQSSTFWKILIYLVKPGTIALILVAMCVIVYYLRAKAYAQKDMVNILKNMLVLEAKDKEFLLENISKVTEGQWQYNLHEQSPENWDSHDNSVSSKAEMKRAKFREDLMEGDAEISSGSENAQLFPRDHSSNDSTNFKRNIYAHRKKYA
ncbi:hypothetical protein ILUMI_26881 [Ignelater luminosus]|uniref:TMC domain-containing protein n=1 Tax=Ignelater luminosus TaxID=2038154 RepID=A0A8K0C585_IGNLU|nr:hypothetical protein ILUMI_26881 [Ignelater luminosus]